MKDLTVETRKNNLDLLMESCEQMCFVKLDAILSIDQLKNRIKLRVKSEKNLRIKREKT